MILGAPLILGHLHVNSWSIPMFGSSTAIDPPENCSHGYGKPGFPPSWEKIVCRTGNLRISLTKSSIQREPRCCLPVYHYSFKFVIKDNHPAPKRQTRFNSIQRITFPQNIWTHFFEQICFFFPEKISAFSKTSFRGLLSVLFFDEAFPQHLGQSGLFWWRLAAGQFPNRPGTTLDDNFRGIWELCGKPNVDHPQNHYTWVVLTIPNGRFIIGFFPRSKAIVTTKQLWFFWALFENGRYNLNITPRS